MIVVKIIPPFSHFKLRAIEWGLAAMLFCMGTIFLNADFNFNNSPALSELARLNSEKFWGWLCITIGGMRLVALWMNGAWRRSPYVRALTALFSSLLWLQITLGLVVQPLLTIGIAIFPFLIFLDWFSVWRAMDDADTYRKENKANNPSIA